MAYSLQLRRQVLDQIHQGMNPSEAARLFGITDETARIWMKNPEKYLSEDQGKLYDLEEKVRVIRWLETGEVTARQITEQKGISARTISKWIADKRRILALYSSQEQTSVKLDKTKSSGEEEPIVSKSDKKDEKQYNRSLKEENEFLKAKVAYLEAVMELKGIPLSELKKKRSTRPSTKSSETESDR